MKHCLTNAHLKPQNKLVANIGSHKVFVRKQLTKHAYAASFSIHTSYSK